MGIFGIFITIIRIGVQELEDLLSALGLFRERAYKSAFGHCYYPVGWGILGIGWGMRQRPVLSRDAYYLYE